MHPRRSRNNTPASVTESSRRKGTVGRSKADMIKAAVDEALKDYGLKKAGGGGNDNDMDRPPPFTQKVLMEPLPTQFRMPEVEPYDGRTDPDEHVENFKTVMLLHPVPDAILCRAFPTTLRGAARRWYSGLKPHSIGRFRELSRQFRDYFITSRRQKKTSASLNTVRQAEGEQLREYLARFRRAAWEVKGLKKEVALAHVIAGLARSRFTYSVIKNPPATLEAFYKKAEKWIAADDVFEAYRARSEAESSGPEDYSQRWSEGASRGKDSFGRQQGDLDRTLH